MARKKKLNWKFEGTLEFGSEFQEEAGMQIIDAMMRVMKMHLETRHKSNQISYKFVKQHNG